MKTRTASEIASELAVDVETARGLIRFLVAAKLAKFRGERPDRQKIYALDESAPREISKILAKLV